ncbi:MAG: ABC transporter ATP-binding protein [Fulvivirga sp.]|nr:ABC transporter ATP-binding protein [Fulvivirga sp.]
MKIVFDQVSFTYKYGAPPIINNFSFEANSGESTVIKGPSGSGKTTIFRLLLGFEQPDSGTISINQKTIEAQAVDELRKQTAWLPQDLDLGEGKVKDLFYFPYTFKKNSSDRPAKESIMETFLKLDLPEQCLEESFDDLSTGQRQRVGLAMCYHLNKPIILLDEPTSALDDAVKQKVRKLLFADSSKLILSTSHDPWWIDACDQVIDLKSN